MLASLTAIFVCQLIGEIVATALALPLPGPVIGLVILFLFLLAKGSVPEGIGRVADGLLANLSLLFVPAGTGIMMHFARLKDEALGVGVALVVSTLATIAVTALVMQRLGRTAASEAGDD